MRRFNALASSARSIVFYAEDTTSWVHFEPIIQQLTGPMRREICYLTSSHRDPILKTENEKIRAFCIGEGVVRTFLFVNLRAGVLVMTMPDLETFHIKRSKLHPVHYVYVFHSIVSTYMTYRKGAFDHFDTVLCVGPHHIREIRATEATYGLKPKNLVEHGYGRLDRLLQEKFQRNSDLPAGKGQKKWVLVAPSWGHNALLETRGVELVKILLEAGYHVTVRPHPVTQRKWPDVIQALKDRFQGDSDFLLVTDVTSEESLHASNIMVSDWSGVALEYAFGLERPVLFVDVPPKVNNPYYGDIPYEPLEVAIRSEIGLIVSPDRLSEIPAKIEKLCDDSEAFRKPIRHVRTHTVYNIGTSGAVGASYIAQIADE
ncbi:MAG: CDP-glycerol glycerophosphotransferase family protein [Candidatus Binatia bacterium]